MISINRFIGNPFLSPQPTSMWESQAVFNGCIIEDTQKYHLLYRALSNNQSVAGKILELSTIGHAVGTDRIHFEKRTQLIRPEYDWERFGCEDPRLCKLDDKFLIFYTALSTYPPTPEGIKVAVAITKDLEKIEEKHLVTPFNAKAMAIFPERINGKIAAILTTNTDLPPAKIGIAFFEKETQIWDKSFWNTWYETIDHHTLPLLRNKHDHLELGAPPLKTAAGWLVIYSYIRNYQSQQKIFGIEAVLLDLENPLKILGRTEEPLMVPEKSYELNGKVSNVVFPSGALIHNDTLGIYYGAADTSCCLATCNLNELLEILRPKPRGTTFDRDHILFRRFSGNPIITPILEHLWEDKYTLNPATINLKNKIHILYRAMGKYDTSVLGYAASSDGIHIDERLPNPVYMPREEFERKLQPGHSGCEDPRITQIDNQLFMCYTAYDGVNPTRVALTSITVDDFCAKRWKWERPVLISPPGMNDKNACVLPDKINGKYVFFHRLHSCIWVDFVDSLQFGEGKWLGGHVILRPQPDTWYSEKIGIAAPPLKTADGWLLIFHGLSHEDLKYRLGAALLNLDNPTLIRTMLSYPLLEPRTKYENSGLRPGTVFGCGAVILDNNLFVYYGGADQVVCVASISLKNLLEEMHLMAKSGM